MSKPFVTCICPTAAERDRKWLRAAIRCFERQIYTNMELVVAFDEGDDRADVDAPFHRVIVPRGTTLGQKRNLACSAGSGEIIAHLDDDDWSSPERIEFQVGRLLQSGKAVSGLHNMKFTDGRNWWLYVNPDFPVGTSLCYLRSWWKANPFQNQRMGSDTLLTFAAIAQNQLDLAPCGELMVAGVHPQNTWKRSYSPPTFVPTEPIHGFTLQAA